MYDAEERAQIDKAYSERMKTEVRELRSDLLKFSINVTRSFEESTMDLMRVASDYLSECEQRADEKESVVPWYEVKRCKELRDRYMDAAWREIKEKNLDEWFESLYEECGYLADGYVAD